jgi:glyceraldehyde 3-phosphate dehydrogenase (phosphorylating)
VSPVLAAIDQQYGVVSAHLETIHSYTSDQNLADNFHARDRRGRAAALNLVLTETGAARAISKVLPALADKLTGNAIRVPTPDVSLAMLMITVKKADASLTVDSLNAYLQKCSLWGPYSEQIGFSYSPDAASTDFIGSQDTGIVDSKSTIVSGDRIGIYVWYDNEYGYARQLVRVLTTLSGLQMPTFPAVAMTDCASSSSSSSSSTPTD